MKVYKNVQVCHENFYKGGYVETRSTKYSSNPPQTLKNMISSNKVLWHLTKNISFNVLALEIYLI